MTLRVNDENRDRIGSAAGVAAIHALLAWALLTGLGFSPAEAGREALKMFDVTEEPPPPPAEPPPPERVQQSKKAKPKDEEGAAAPPNLKNTPTQIVAPSPKVELKLPTPIPAAPAAGQGTAVAAGAAPVPGPGTGRGGIGTGLGAGLHGTGPGGGGGGLGRATPARHIAGGIGPEDYPDAAYARRDRGTVHMRFVVAPTGRVRECAVTRSSGSRDLDAATCRLILRRFRYRPARNAEGQPIPYVINGTQRWEIGPEPPPTEVEPIEDPYS